MAYKYNTKQEIFDVVYRGLASQGFRQSVKSTSWSDTGPRCRYRSEVGKCAAGWLIPDEMYDPKFDGGVCDGGGAIGNVYRMNEAVQKLFPQVLMSFVTSLQDHHDTAHDPVDMQRRLEATAQAFNLKVPELDHV